MNYKRIMAMVMIVVMAAGLSGCGSRKTLQEQVTENLLQMEDIPETDLHNGEVTVPKDLSIEQEVKEAVKEASKEETADSLEQEIVVQEPEEIKEEDIKEETGIDENKIQIVFLGDSIFDNARDGTGVPYLTGVACNANIYNLAIGGTPAALFKDQKSEREEWDSCCMLGIVHAVTGVVQPDFFSHYHAKKVFDECDFSKTDYFVLEYGTNDFLARIPLTNNSPNVNDPYSYYGAVRMAVSELRSNFPEATVIFVTPHYEQFWGAGKIWLGDCNTLDLGYGTLSDYIAGGYNAAASAGAVSINAYNDMGIDGYTAEEYLEDGIHLTEAGRRTYAEVLARRINNMELSKAN